MQGDTPDKADEGPVRWPAWKRWLCTLMVIGAGCAGVYGYLFVKNIAIPTYQHAKRVERAEAMFKALCKRSGVFIHRTVSDVEEIRLINVRDDNTRSSGQFVLWDPYGDEYGDEIYIASFLQYPAQAHQSDKEHVPRYRAVYAEFPERGRLLRFQYLPALDALVKISKYRELRADERRHERSYLLAGDVADKPGPRYGLRFKDISTREMRSDWIAGSALQVVDLESDEVIAERVGFLWDSGFGDSTAGREPWAVAARHACPAFEPLPGKRALATARDVQQKQAFRFVRQVLIPKPLETPVNSLNIDELSQLSRLQMAAEADLAELDPAQVTAPEVAKALRNGNSWASRFTAVDASAFSMDWEIAAHRSDRRSGFSGSVFRNLHTQQTVMSLRSTEFIDDAVRDNLATNALEIRKTGFAWGQLADLQKWYGKLKQQGLVQDGQFTLTGYSLGGHLATAFNLMNPTAAKQTVTFNGAGVGQVRSGTLAEALKHFEQLRASPHLILSTLSASEREAALYRDLRAHLADGSWSVKEALSEIDARFPPSQAHAPGGRSLRIPYRSSAIDQMRTSLKEMNLLHGEIARLKEVSAGDQRPRHVPASEVAALDLDYRMAVGLVGAKTRSASSLANLKQAYGERAVLAVPEGNTALANQFDVSGDTSPSMVANCQWHYGQEVRVPIENQPSYRGGIGLGVVDASIRHGDVKLLVNDFDRKDFGDTHSLVLLVDSLAVQRALCDLLAEPVRDGATGVLSTVMKRASSLRAEDGSLLMGSGQGRAEGDVLENVTNALAALCLGPAGFARLKGNPEGGSWAEVGDKDVHSGRESLHALLKRISDSPVYQALKDASAHLRLSASDRLTGDGARKDFGAFAALFALSPFTLYIDKAMGASPELASALAAAWGDHFSMWQEDRPVRDKEQIRNVSHEWIEARSEMLDLLMVRNEANEHGPSRTGSRRHFRDLESDLDFHTAPPVSSATVREMSDLIARLALQRHIKQVKFGGPEADELKGGLGSDRLFGGAGNDRLGGDAGADHLEGGAGDDLLDGGAGADLLIGGPGDDTYRVSDGDVIVDKDGRGRIVLAGRELSGVAQPDGRHRWIGSHKENYVWAGKDLLIELEGARVTVRAPMEKGRTLGIELPPAETGNLALELIGGNDDDLLVKDVKPRWFYKARWVIDEWSSYDLGSWEPREMVRATHRLTAAARGVELLVHEVSQADAVPESPDHDRLHGAGGNDWLLAGGGNDEVDGGAGDDVLYGEQGHDHVTGGAGDDRISGDNLGYLTELSVGHGDDVLDGGDGDDVVVGNGGADIIDGGAGDDILLGDDALSPASGHGADELRGGAGHDRLFGNGGDDRLSGDSGDDFLAGGAGADHLSGADGDDQLLGDGPEADMKFPPMMMAIRDKQYAAVVRQASSETASDLSVTSPGECGDTLLGGAGDDRLDGGPGDDHLEGGGGSDVYTRGLGDGHDVIRETADPAARDIDILRLDASLTAARTSVERLGEDMMLRWSTSDSVLIEGQFAPQGTARIEKLEFADGSSWSHEMLASRTEPDPRPTSAAGAERDERGGLTRRRFMTPRLEGMDETLTVAEIDWRGSRFVVDGAFAQGARAATLLQTHEIEPGRTVAWVGFHSGAYTKAVRLEVLDLAHGGLAAHVTDAKFADGDVNGQAFDWESAGTRTLVAVHERAPGYGLAEFSLAVSSAASQSWTQGIGLSV